MNSHQGWLNVYKPINITSFGLDQNSELLICANANIYKLISDEEP